MAHWHFFRCRSTPHRYASCHTTACKTPAGADFDRRYFLDEVPKTKSSPGTINLAQLRVKHFIPEDFKRKQSWHFFLTKLELSLRYFTNFWSTRRPGRRARVRSWSWQASSSHEHQLSSSFSHRRSKALLLHCKSPFYGYHEYPLEPSSLMSCCRT